MVTKAEEALVVRKLVDEKFGTKYSVEALKGSNNGHHYILTDKSKVKTHLKVINDTALAEEGLDEIGMLKEIKSPYVIELLDEGSLDDDYKYLVFPHIDGKTLDKIHPASGWSNDELRKLTTHITTAIEALGKVGVVHRDIKPKNIIREERTGNYILLDLGIGYFIDQADRDTSKARGSRNYSSPEQFISITSDTDEISPAGDLFSLGVILHELASGEHPFITYDKKKYASIGEAICRMPATPIQTLRKDMDSDLQEAITKMLEKNPSKRYLRPKLLLDRLAGTSPDKIQQLRYFVADPFNIEKFEGYIADTPKADRPNGVVLPIESSDDRIDRILALDLHLLIDPMVYKLPYPKSSQSAIRKKLDLGVASYNLTKLNDDKVLRKITQRVVNRQDKASAVILPYFTISTIDDPSIEINRKVEDIYFKHLKGDENRKVFAGVMIARSLIVNPKTRTKLLDRLMRSSKVDGYYLIFENSDSTPHTIEDTDYIDGVSEIISMFKTKGAVIVGRADIAFIPILKHGVFVTSPKKPERRYSFKDKLIDPKEQKGSTGEEKHDLVYYSDPLFNFIKGKPLLESLATLGFENEIGCDCDYCTKSKPFDSTSTKSHLDSRKHFYLKIAQLRNKLSGKKESEVDTILLQQLENASRIATEIESKIPGERFSHHERLIESIKS